MEPSKNTKTKDRQHDPVKSVMALYGAALFSGLLLSIFTHQIEDISGFLLFLVPSAVLYFLVLILYFKEGFLKKVAFAIVGFIALISIFMVFYLEINSAGM